MHATLDVLDHLDERQFVLAVKGLADSLSYGSDPSPFRGTGLEYVQSRIYEPGDAVKSIDWRVTARTGKAHVKEYEAPKRTPTYLVLDTSASMCVTSQPVSKYAWAVQLAGALALSSLSRLSPVALVGCGERELRTRPSLSRLQVYTWLYALRRYRLDEQTTLGDALRRIEPMMENRSLLVVLSDMHDPAALPVLKPLAQKHDCVVLQLQDPAESGRLRGGGLFRAREAETDAPFVSHGRGRWIDDGALDRELKHAQVDHIRMRTDEPFLPHLRAFLRRRDKAGRGAR
jgi:uncharacterized protein (DUF58 family)